MVQIDDDANRISFDRHDHILDVCWPTSCWGRGVDADGESGRALWAASAPVLHWLGRQPRRRAIDDKLLFRIPEVASALNVSRSKVYELLQTGALRSVRIDRTRLVRADDLKSYVDSLPIAG